MTAKKHSKMEAFSQSMFYFNVPAVLSVSGARIGTDRRLSVAWRRASLGRRAGQIGVFAARQSRRRPAPCPRQHTRRRRYRRPADAFRSDLRPRHISTCPLCFKSTADAAAAHVAAVPAASVERVWRDVLRYRANQQLLWGLEPRHGWSRGTSAPVRVPPGECTAAGCGGGWNCNHTGCSRPGTGQATATCCAAASAPTAAAMLRRPRWPQDCAGDPERIGTLRSPSLNHC